MHCKVGEVYNIPISHGEGRFVASDEVIAKLIENGQIATQYVDLNGEPTMDLAYNPNSSMCAIEGIRSEEDLSAYICRLSCGGQQGTVTVQGRR